MNSPVLDMLQMGVLGGAAGGGKPVGVGQGTGSILDRIFADLLGRIVNQVKPEETAETKDGSADPAEAAGAQMASAASATAQSVVQPVAESTDQAAVPADQATASTAVTEGNTRGNARTVSLGDKKQAGDQTNDQTVSVSQAVSTSTETPSSGDGPEAVSTMTDAQIKEIENLFGHTKDEGIIIRPFQKVAGDLFAHWANEGKLKVAVDRPPTPQSVIGLTQAGEMLAAKLQPQNGAKAPDADTQTSGWKAVNGPDFSVRGSVFQISPDVNTLQSQEVNLLTSTGELTIQPSTPADTGQGASTGDQSAKDQPEVTPDVADLKKDHEAGNHGFSAVLHSQGPAHAASAKPSEVIAVRPQLADKVLNQIVSDVKLHVRENDARVQIRLDPPELGTLKVEIVSREGVVTANLQSGNDTVRNLLETNLPALRNALQQAGIKVNSFHVSTGLDMNQYGDRRNDAWDRPRSTYVKTGSSEGIDSVSAFTPRAGMESAAGYSWLA